MRKWWDVLKLMHMRMWVCLGGKAADWITHSKGEEPCTRKWCDITMTSWKTPRIPHKGIKGQSELLDQPEQLKTMISEVFLAVFHVCFDASYDASNESCLRWWINESIRDFIAPTFILRQSTASVYSAMRRTPSQGTIVDYGRIFLYFPRLDGTGPRWMRVVLSYELMMEAEHQFRIKQEQRCRMPLPLVILWQHPTMQLRRCWNVLPGVSPDSKTLEHLVWSVYDGLLSPGPMPK